MTHHLRCTPCRLRFDRRRIPDLDACPACGGALQPLPLADAPGLPLFRGIPAADPGETAEPAWTTALAAAIQRLPPAAR